MRGKNRQRNLHLYSSAEHPCGYLEGETAVSWFVDPAAALDSDRYELLLAHGLRRSGQYVYRPGCPRCDACVPSRIRLKEFKLRRWARRNLSDNRDLRMELNPNEITEEVHQLYDRYQRWRHPDSDMCGSTRADVESFFYANWQTSLSLAWRLGDQMVAFAVVDRTPEALSCVYTLYDPDHSARGLGTFAILSLASLARQYHCHWLYLGYWIPDSPKMAYKARFAPLETLENGHWRRVAR